MADDDSQEKTEEASGRKIEKAREEGQVPRSRDLTTSVVLLVGSIGLLYFSDFMGEKYVEMTRENFILSRETIFDPNAMIGHFVSTFYMGLVSMMPFMALMLAASVIGPVALGGWLFSADALMPKMSRMDPMAGLKRMFSMKSLIELLKATAKVTIIIGATVMLLKHYSQPMFRMSDEDINLAIIHSVKISAYAAIALSACTLIIAAFDVPLQIYEYNKKLKMSKQELKDESKDTDGKPEVKGRIRQLQREMAQRRMMSNVPTADVIITNPTHYAVALKYNPEAMSTPILLAKGGDNIALKIREIAKAHNIEIIESPVLARAIFHTTELDNEIPSGLYLAVAQVLAYVFQLKSYRKGRGQKPKYPNNIKVPKDMYFD
ncbi:MAG: flagellar biosynthesis protein FlhB [Gammaproteobacteria bacterium]|nr:MAG: flagellar biosynthesis protein FlhB [Gammaproteobacteria bacterium]